MYVAIFLIVQSLISIEHVSSFSTFSLSNFQGTINCYRRFNPFAQYVSGGDATELGTKDYSHEDNDENIESSMEQNKKIRFRARAAYDGSGFRGWQVQAKGRTCQAELENVLSTRFNRIVKIVGAGRTDASVHARGQAFHFDVYPNEIVTKGNIDESLSTTQNFCKQLQKSLNSMLKDDIRIYNVMECPPPVEVTHQDGSVRTHKWHVIYNSQKKLYVYRISLRPKAVAVDPIERYRRVHVDGDIDPHNLQRILRHYEGTHDFRAFSGAIEANMKKDGVEHKDTVRTVYSCDLIDEGEGNYRIEIHLKGALYKMVRNMVGTAIDVAKGRFDEEKMLVMLHQKKEEQLVRKDNKCKPAPGEGLTLEKVYFEEDGFHF